MKEGKRESTRNERMKNKYKKKERGNNNISKKK